MCDYLNALHLPTSALAVLRAPSSLPDSLNGFFFETQWTYWIILGLAVAALLYTSRNRKDKRLGNAAVAAAILLLAWILAAYAVDTPRERLYAAHTALAKAARDGDTDRILSFLSDEFVCPSLGIGRAALARDQLGPRLKAYGIHGSTITAYHSDISGQTAFTTLSVITDTDSAGPIPSSWSLSWDDVTGADWKIKEADLTQLADKAVSGDWIIPKSPL